MMADVGDGDVSVGGGGLGGDGCEDFLQTCKI